MASRILAITIRNVIFQISISVLEQVLRPHGDLLRVVIFDTCTGPDVLQVLAEFATPAQAEAARAALNDKDIYDNCCTLGIEMSARDVPLVVRENNERSWDWVGAAAALLPSPLTQQAQQHPPSALGLPPAAAVRHAGGGSAPPMGVPVHHGYAADVPVAPPPSGGGTSSGSRFAPAPAPTGLREPYDAPHIRFDSQLPRGSRGYYHAELTTYDQDVRHLPPPQQQRHQASAVASYDQPSAQQPAYQPPQQQQRHQSGFIDDSRRGGDYRPPQQQSGLRAGTSLAPSSGTRSGERPRGRERSDGYSDGFAGSGGDSRDTGRGGATAPRSAVPPSSSAPQQQKCGSGGYNIAPLYKLGQAVAGDGRSSGGRDWQGQGQQQSFDSRGGGGGGGYAPFLPQGGAGDRDRELSRFGERDRPPPPPLESEERPFPYRSLPYNGPNGRAEWRDGHAASRPSFSGPRGPASGEEPGGDGDVAPRDWGGDCDWPRGGAAAGGGTSYCSGGGWGSGLRDWPPPSHQGGGQQQGRDWPRRDDDDGGWHARRCDRLLPSADRSPIDGGGRFVESAVIVVYNLVWRRGDDLGVPELEKAAEDGAAATVEAAGAEAADPANADTSAESPAAVATGGVATTAAAPPPFDFVVSHDSLYNLFCNYGGVVRIKLLLRPPHAAIIEMADSAQASIAIASLKSATVNGRVLDLQRSQLRSVLMPLQRRERCLFKQYSLARQPNGGRPPKLVHVPCRTLFYFNAPPRMTERAIRELLLCAGASLPLAITLIDNNEGESASYAGRGGGERPSCGFFDYENVSTATGVIMLMNNTEYNGFTLRVTFASKERLPQSTVDAALAARAAAGGAVATGDGGAAYAGQKRLRSLSYGVNRDAAGDTGAILLLEQEREAEDDYAVARFAPFASAGEHAVNPGNSSASQDYARENENVIFSYNDVCLGHVTELPFVNRLEQLGHAAGALLHNKRLILSPSGFDPRQLTLVFSSHLFGAGKSAFAHRLFRGLNYAFKGKMFYALSMGVPSGAPSIFAAIARLVINAAERANVISNGESEALRNGSCDITSVASVIQKRLSANDKDSSAISELFLHFDEFDLSRAFESLTNAQLLSCYDSVWLHAFVPILLAPNMHLVITGRAPELAILGTRSGTASRYLSTSPTVAFQAVLGTLHSEHILDILTRLKIQSTPTGSHFSAFDVLGFAPLNECDAAAVAVIPSAESRANQRFSEFVGVLRRLTAGVPRYVCLAIGELLRMRVQGTLRSLSSMDPGELLELFGVRGALAWCSMLRPRQIAVCEPDVSGAAPTNQLRISTPNVCR